MPRWRSIIILEILLLVYGILLKNGVSSNSPASSVGRA